jgi:cysteinyl-tRNA synthetase
LAVTIRLFDSKSQQLRDFVPLVEGKVGMYVCGPTVQSSPHIGHLRSALVYDQLRRWLSHEGLDVTLVRNVTDIDDKVLENARAAGVEEWWALAYRMEREFNDAYTALRIQAPTYEPRATASIPEMVDLIRLLMKRGHAYAVPGGNGDVYFDTASWPQYGELTNQIVMVKPQPDPVEEAEVGKRDPRDFALWKTPKAGEPASASWDTSWGRGRPGWHIECSAMATKYLGTSFDIHGGGLDLRFPHHENELAQSAAAGHGFAQTWLHNGLVSVGDQKMSKSLGNSLFTADLLASARPIVVRYFLGSAHYRSQLEFHATALAEAQSAFERIEGFLSRASRAGGELAVGSVRDEFRAAMNDDMSIPQALAVVHDTVRSGNAAFDAGDNAGGIEAAMSTVAMLDALGLNPLSAEWKGAHADGGATKAALTSLVDRLLEARTHARENKDYATSDRIRDDFASAGIIVEDTPQGVHWSIDGE